MIITMITNYKKYVCIDDVMVSLHHYATLRNDTVVHDNGTIEIK